MDLSRRDALAALTATGVAVGGGAALYLNGQSTERDSSGPPSRNAGVETLVSVAQVVYPAEVTGIREFVRTYARGRMTTGKHDPEAITAVTEALDETISAFYDAERFAELPEATRDEALREMGVHTAEPDPAGTTAERVRYYFVNEVLYALYASPKGGELIGIENPQGYPGGTNSYQHGPGQ
jgi:hypothetical protein